MSPMPALRDLNKLNSFVRVAERLSFTRAANDLRTRPSVLSKHMNELEEALGFSLLSRSTHGVVLTEAGQGLFDRCLQLLANLDEYIVDTRNLQTGPYGVLRIQAASGYAQWYLARLISEFVSQHPNLRVQISAETATANPVEEGFDIILASKKPTFPGLLECDVGPVPHVICASPAYFRKFGRPKTPQDLAEHNCFANSFAAPRGWWFKIGSRKKMIGVKGGVTSNSPAVLAQIALDGLGVIRVPRYSVKEALEKKRLESIFDDQAQSPERLRAYFAQTKYLPAKISNFVDFLRKSNPPA